MLILLATAASIGFGHTLLGPDHYVPFVAMAQARGWARTKTVWITLVCGVGHIAGSILLGIVGILAGLGVERLEMTESVRGSVAAWLLIAFGLVYLVWGLRRAFRHRHSPEDGVEHAHPHRSAHEHHHRPAGKKSLTPWILFLIFAFGPCEALIPMLMYPAARHDFWFVGMVVAVFALATLATMLGAVLLLTFGLSKAPTGSLERYSHALAGGMILACGVSIVFLGL